VTPGNKAAAVVAGLNVIVFTIITYLAHREKEQKKQLQAATASSISSGPSIADGNEKNLSLGVHTVEIGDH